MRRGCWIILQLKFWRVWRKAISLVREAYYSEKCVRDLKIRMHIFLADFRILFTSFWDFSAQSHFSLILLLYVSADLFIVISWHFSFSFFFWCKKRFQDLLFCRVSNWTNTGVYIEIEEVCTEMIKKWGETLAHLTHSTFVNWWGLTFHVSTCCQVKKKKKVLHCVETIETPSCAIRNLKI